MRKSVNGWSDEVPGLFNGIELNLSESLNGFEWLAVGFKGIGFVFGGYVVNEFRGVFKKGQIFVQYL